jgi:metallo-beta-lactamase family protein
VRAAIVHLSGFSAHADQNELLRWLQAQRSTKSHVYLVHGEPASAYALAGALTDRSITASVARRGETVTL